tara:strand:+ start:497 stop:652 length:156 start_codon:yes stop_codon:yes gene_type:complete
MKNWAYYTTEARSRHGLIEDQMMKRGEEVYCKLTSVIDTLKVKILNFHFIQ